MEFADHLALELDQSVNQRIQSRVAGHFDVLAGMVLGAMLADDDFAFFDRLVAENFHA